MKIGFRVRGVPGIFGFGESADITDWINYALTAHPQFSSSTLEMTTGELKGGRVSLTLNGSADLRRLFLYQAVEPVAYLDEDISSSATSFLLDRVIDADTEYLYVGDETMTVTNVSDLTVTVTRGSFKSGTFNFGEKTPVFNAPAYWRRRPMEILIYEDDVTEEVRWVGLIDEPPRTSSTMLNIELDCIHPFELGSDLIIGPEKTYEGRFAIDPSFQLASKDAFFAPGTPILSPVRYKVTLYTFRVIDDERLVPSSVVSGFDDISTGLTKDLVWHRFMVVSRSLAYSDLRRADYPYHPLTIAGAILFSTNNSAHDPSKFDLLVPQFSAGLDYLIDAATLTTWHEFIEATSYMEVDFFSLLWDNEATPILEILNDLLSYFGLVLGINKNGYLIPAFKGAIAVNEVEESPLQTHKDICQWENPRIGSKDRIVAEAQGIPTNLPATQTVMVDAFAGGVPQSQGESIEYSFNFIDRLRLPEIASTRLLSIALERYRGTPTLRIRVDGSNIPELGRNYRLLNIRGLETPIFPLADRTLTNDLEQDSFVGKVVERLWLAKDNCYEIKLALSVWPFGALAKLRGPSGIIDEVIEELGHMELDVAGNFGQSGPAGAEFAVGQKVEVWTEDGERRAGGVGTIESIVSGSVFLNPYPDPLHVSPGDILRLAQYPSFDLDPRNFAFINVGDRYR